MATRTVTVQQVVNDLSYLDASGSEKALGTIYQEVYGDDEVKRFTFRPDKDNPFIRKGKEEDGYVLGYGSAHMHFVNPADAQRAALDRGLELRDVLAYKGGLQMKSYFIDPEKRWGDMINYDYQFWEKQRREPGEVFALLQLDTNLRIGHMAARYVSGLYRQICSNGLAAPLLGLPTISIRHSEWETDNIEAQLEDIEFGTGVVLDITRRPLTQMRHLTKALNVLNRLAAEAQSPEGVSTEMTLLRQRFPTITAPRGKTFNNFVEQLELLLKTYPEETAAVTGLQIVNAYTNAVSVERFRGSSRGAFDALEGMNSIITETVSLANMAAIFN